MLSMLFFDNESREFTSTANNTKIPDDMNKILQDLVKLVGYSLKDCLILKFVSSKLTMDKLNKSDVTTTDVICPFLKEQLPNIQIALR